MDSPAIREYACSESDRHLRRRAEGGAPMPHARLRRSRHLHALCSLFCLLLVAVLAGCGASSGPIGTLRPTATVGAAPPARLAGSTWERLSLPAPSDQVYGFAVSPRDPATLF